MVGRAPRQVGVEVIPALGVRDLAQMPPVPSHSALTLTSWNFRAGRGVGSQLSQSLRAPPAPLWYR